MENLTHSENISMFLMMTAILVFARVLGELAQKFHQPAVLGEILAGILLGPTLFGALAPEWNSWLFPMQGHSAVVLSAVRNISMVLFLLVAGLEVDLATVWRQGKTAATVGVAGLMYPFCGRHHPRKPCAYGVGVGGQIASYAFCPVFCNRPLYLSTTGDCPYPDGPETLPH